MLVQIQYGAGSGHACGMSTAVGWKTGVLGNRGGFAGKFPREAGWPMPLPLEGGTTLVLTRRTQPDLDQRVLLERLGWELPLNALPRITEGRGLEA